MRGANAVAEAMGYGRGFHALDDDTIRRFVNTRWASGKSYSEAIWGDSERVAAWVQDDMAKALARGESCGACATSCRGGSWTSPSATSCAWS